MKKFYLLVLFVLFTLGLSAQNQGKIWYFGNYAGLDFNTEPPTALTNGALTTTEGCASISDANGSLLFYTDGIKVWNKNHQSMPNASGTLASGGLGGNPSSAQSAIIVPDPASNSRYYVFAVSAYPSSNINYSLVDMTLNGGLGDVVSTTKAIPLISATGEYIQATPSADRTFWWVATHKANTNQYYAYKVTAAGVDVSNPVVSSVGTAIPVGGEIGYMKFNSKGTRSVRTAYTVAANGYAELCDFDNATGVFSNPLKLAAASAYGAEFSPNDRFLYVGSFGVNLYQFDLNAGSTESAISATRYTFGGVASYGAFQSAPDGKIYISKGGSSLDVINAPNSLGAACNYAAAAQSLGGKTATYGLPNIISSFVSTGPPQISGIASSNVTGTTATISANVTSDGGEAISERGFYYGTSAIPTANKTVVSGTTGSLSENLTGLTAGTTYYFRGFATNTNGTAYTTDGTFTTTNSAPSFTCPEVDRRNNGNGQASSCAGVNGTPMATNVVGTAYATVPTASKTGDITFRWTTLPSDIPVITNVWINGVLSAAQVGPPSVTTQSGGFYKIEYCFYNVNLPNAGTYTLEFTDPQTGNVIGRCSFNGQSNISASEPTLTTNAAPVITGPNGSGTTTAATAAKSIPENTTAVGTYTADKTVTWSISGTDAAKFTISTSGVLTFTNAPDYENPGDTDTNNTYIVTITATDEYGGTKTQTLTVTVTDVNECTISPTLISRVTISDYQDDRIAVLLRDVSVLGTQESMVGQYMVVNGVEYQLMSNWTSADGYWYYFRVSPSFPGPDASFNNVFFKCSSNPVITGPNGSGTTTGSTAAKFIQENTTAVGSYTADETVTWSISGTDASKFTMSASGVLTFTTAPDYETPTDADTNNTYVVIITATDASGNTTTQTLTVTVTNIVDETPSVITGPNGSGTTTGSTAAKSIPENTTTVSTYTANEPVTWSISGTDASKFTMSASGVLTFTSGPDYENPSDADTNNTYILIVTATDASGNITTQTLTVTVLKDFDGDGIPDDIDPDDDNDGILDKDELDCSTSTSISQALNPSPFYFVQWTSLSNGVLSGVINVPGNPVHVTVTNTLGSIKLQNDSPFGGTADWAPQPSGNPYASTFRSVTQGEHKFVFDQPVNNPRFFINSLNKTLELSQPGNILKSNGKFTGTPTGSITSVLVGNEANGTISFNGNVTEVSFTGRDYEFYCNFSLGIANVADYSTCVDKDTDGDGIPDRLDLDSDGDGVTDAQEKADGTSPTDLCSFVLANQTLTPSATWNGADCDGDGTTNEEEVARGSNPLVADVEPVITGPNGSGTTTTAISAKTFPENSTAVVYTFTANKTVTWSLNGGQDAAKFSINATTGALTFLTAPDYETPTDGSTSGTNTYVVVIKATDVYGLTKTQTLTVTVTDVDDTAPVITGPNGSGTTTGLNAAKTIPENTTAVGTYTANETVSWSISGTDASKFTMSALGVLTFTTAPNYESPTDVGTNNTYIVTITATDLGGNITTQTLTVTVSNVNETPTDITLSQNSIYDANAIAAVIGNLSTTDPDMGDTHSYTLVSGAGSGDNSSFSISNNQLKAGVVFNYNSRNSYSVRIRTTDAGGLSYEEIFTVSILKSPLATGTGNIPGTNQISAASNNVTISKGYSSQLNVTGSGLVSYSWSPSTGLSSTNTATPIASPTQTTTYAVTVTNNLGLSTVVYVTVNVIEDFNITPRNAITPNGDGKNDTWVVENIANYPNSRVLIFDRAGRQLYSATNYQNTWDGTVNGVPLKEDTYFYVIDFGVGVNPKKGFISIIR
ncbi:MAG: gliding motility-associated C-terminal domain-containing protein [Sphingobacteriaceae bacterium]